MNSAGDLFPRGARQSTSQRADVSRTRPDSATHSARALRRPVRFLIAAPVAGILLTRAERAARARYSRTLFAATTIVLLHWG